MGPVLEATPAGKKQGFCASGQEVKLGGPQDQFQLHDYSREILPFQKGAESNFSRHLVENNILLGTTP